MTVVVEGKILRNLSLLLLAVIVSSCSMVARKGDDRAAEVLSERRLWEIHRDIFYTHFEYKDGGHREGLLLNWQPDSILVQPRGENKPIRIPAEGLRSIRVEVGNRIWEGLAVGSAASAIYVALAKSYELNDVSLGQALWKLFVPPSILVSSIVAGSSMRKYEEYTVPEGFKFDYDEANSLYKLLE